MTVFHAVVELSKASWRVLRGNPRLAWFPVLSLACALGLLMIVAPILAPGDDDIPWLMLIVIIAITHVTQVFFTVALTGEALKALRGEPTSITNGLATATTRLPAIAAFSTITGTFGFLLGTFGRSRHVAVKVARAIVGTAWSLATYLAIPVMVQERRGGLTSLRRSSDLFRRTWGETTLSEVGIRVLTAHLGLILVLVAVALIDLLGDSFGILVVFVLVVAAFAVIGTLEAIYRSALYVFAAEGVIPEPFDSPELEEIWRVR
jgi:hypothetical protein